MGLGNFSGNKLNSRILVDIGNLPWKYSFFFKFFDVYCVWVISPEINVSQECFLEKWKSLLKFISNPSF